MCTERKLDMGKTLKELADEGWTADELLAAYSTHTCVQQKNTEADDKKEDSQMRIFKRITYILGDVGIPAHILGYRYLREAIMMAVINPATTNALTKGLYVDVAKKFATVPSRVERAIRHAIEVAWERGDMEILNGYFGYTISELKGKPTNGEFISKIADIICVEMMENGQ